MDSIVSTFDQGMFGASYGQWALFCLLFVFLWTASLSANAMLRRKVGV